MEAATMVQREAADVLDGWEGSSRAVSRRSGERRTCGDPPRRSYALRRLSRRILARPRPQGGISDRFCQELDRGGLPGGARSGGLWRFGPELGRASCRESVCPYV